MAAAHSIHNGLTALAETHSFYHGEKVAFGVLTGLQLTDAAADETATVFSFCEDVGLPTTLADIGLGKADRRQLMEAAEKACAPGQPIHHEAGSITHQVVEIVEGDRLGPQWPPAVAVAPEVLDRYVGRYRLEAPPPIVAVIGDSVEIRRDGARLLAKGTQGEAEIFPESETEFYSKAGPARISFVSGISGLDGRPTTQAEIRRLMGQMAQEFRLGAPRLP